MAVVSMLNRMRKTRSSFDRSLFCSVAAQHDNLGDIQIRRTILSYFSNRGYRLYVFIGSMPSEYVAAFEFSGDSILIRSKFEFIWTVLKVGRRGEGSLLFAPGPHKLVNSPRGVAKAIGMLIAVIFTRLSGGESFSLGRAFRGRAHVARFSERFISRLSTAYSVRDCVSSRYLGQEAQVIPDLAFSAVQSWAAAEDRPLVAISVRSDSCVDEEALSGLVRMSQEANMEVIFVSQVRRDDEQHRKLAFRFGVESVVWGENTHSEQWKRVLDVYSKAYAVVSNRLHALLFGVAQGAFPVELAVDESDKISSTLEPWLPMPVPIHLGEKSGSLRTPSFLTVSTHDHEMMRAAAAKAQKFLSDYLRSSVPIVDTID